MQKIALVLLLICSLVIGISAQQPVIFRVDMRIPLQNKIFQPAAGDSLLVRGTFNDWQGGVHFLTDRNGEGIYTREVMLEGNAGTSVQYKFVIHKKNGRDIWEFNPDNSNPDHGNRGFTISRKPAQLPLAAFALDRYLLEPGFTFTVSALREDFLQLRDSIESLHPALYAFTDRRSFDDLFDQQLARINKPMPAIDFLRIAAPVVARIGCGHSVLRMPDTWWLTQPERYFPLSLYFTEAGVFLRESWGGIPAGSEVFAINGRPVEEITRFLYTVISADGYNQGYQRAQLNTRFYRYYAQYYGFPENFLVDYRERGSGKSRISTVPPVPETDIKEASQPAPVLSFEILKDNAAAVLRIRNFAFYSPQEEKHFNKFIDSVFILLDHSKTGGLIVDLRGNDGGNPFCAAYLLKYLSSNAIAYFDHPFGRYGPLADPITPTRNKFDGQLCILIDERCFSTTGHLVALLKYHDIGTLIGRETGGTFTCNDAKTLIPLKNTGLELQLARGTFAVAVKNMERSRGVLPDISVPLQIGDLADNRDTVFEYALSLLRD